MSNFIGNIVYAVIGLFFLPVAIPVYILVRLAGVLERTVKRVRKTLKDHLPEVTPGPQPLLQSNASLHLSTTRGRRTPNDGAKRAPPKSEVRADEAVRTSAPEIVDATLANATEDQGSTPPQGQTGRSGGKGQTPYQRLIREMNLGPSLEGEELRRVQAELEQLRKTEPEFYKALLKAKAALEEVAEAMYPSEEEHRRLLANERPEGT